MRTTMSGESSCVPASPTDSSTQDGGGIAIGVFGKGHRGGRKDMEDVLAIVLEFGERGQAFVAVFDGHGGEEAALYAKDHLWDNIKATEGFDTSESEKVKAAIVEGFKKTHQDMWTVRESWKRSKAGTLSTSRTTVSISIIRKDRMYLANVGDSTMVLGKFPETDTSTNSACLVAQVLSQDHKPDDAKEKERIENIGGRVIMSAKGIMRVAWYRERTGSRGFTRGSSSSRPTYDVVPFLNVARSLGDLWSYTVEHDNYYVSPLPDVTEYMIDLNRDNFLIVASDGLWNVVSPQEAVDFVHYFRQDELANGGEERIADSMVANALIKKALRRWHRKSWSADNTSVMVVFFKELEPLFDEQSEDGDEEEVTGAPATRMSSSDSGLPSDCADSPQTDSPLVGEDASPTTCEAEKVRGSDVVCGFSSTSHLCTMEADSKGEASEVVSMETNLQRIKNKGKRKSTEMSAVLSDSPAVFLETAPKRSKSSESMSHASSFVLLDSLPSLYHV